MSWRRRSKKEKKQGEDGQTKMDRHLPFFPFSFHLFPFSFFRRHAMAFVLVIIALALPRILMIFVKVLTDWFASAYDTTIWPLLGWVFLPYTTLAYMAAMLHNNRKVDGWWILLVVAAVLVDIGAFKGLRKK